jgi:hypothetical protein
MKMKDYNSSDVTLRRQHLDKWHTFTQITPTTRATQGWKSGKTSLKNAAFVLPASALNVGATASNQLRLTPSAALAVGSNAFEGISPGDIVSVTVAVPSTAVSVPLTLEVAKVQPDGDSVTKGYLEFKQTVQSVVNIIAAAVSPAAYTPASVPVTAGTTASVSAVMATDATSTVAVSDKTIDTVTIKAHGIPIYNGFVSKFYNAYLPYHYGGPNVSTPKDRGALMIPFNLYPGTYQPSGHKHFVTGQLKNVPSMRFRYLFRK